MSYEDLREFIARLEGERELVHIEAEVDVKYEVVAICHKAFAIPDPEKRKALVFEKPASLGNVIRRVRVAPARQGNADLLRLRVKRTDKTEQRRHQASAGENPALNHFASVFLANFFYEWVGQRCAISRPHK